MNLFDFENFKDFFEFYLSKNSKDIQGKKTSTLNELSKRLGYNSPSILSMIANGERLPSADLLEGLLNEWKFTKSEKELIRLKVEIEKKKRRGKNSIHLMDRYSQLAPYHKIDLRRHQTVSEWYVLVIKLLVCTPDFQEDANWISKRLRKKVTSAKVKRAIQLLLDSKLISRDTNGKLVPVFEHTETSNDLFSEAIRANHRSMMTRAIESIEEQNIKDRQLSSLALQFDYEKMAQAKQRILQFVKEFNQEFQSDNSNKIYQLNVQLFEHTDEGMKNDQ